MPVYEYTNNVNALPVETQVDAEEEIACIIFKAQEESAAKLDGTSTCEGVLSEEDCQELGKAILLRVLTVFRPDLVREAA
jgi:hypothetical protein